MDEAEEVKEILKAAGYEVVDIEGPLGPLIPIAEAIKDAPMHWS
jgi:hypothetical protein